MAQLRGAEDDAENSNYENSRAKIEAVRSVIKRDPKARASSRNPQDRARQSSLGREDTQRSFLHSVRSHSKVSNFSDNEADGSYIRSALQYQNEPS